MGSLFNAPKPPAAFDVGRVQGAQNEQNARNVQDQARVNRIDQTGPFGGISYDPNTGAQTTTLDPNELAMRRQGQDTWGLGAGGFARIAGQDPGTLDRVLNDPENLAAAGARRLNNEFGTPGNLSSNDAFDRAYSFANANIEPRFEQQRAATENRLRNQGLDPTSEAFRSASNDLALQQNEARNNLVTGIQGQLFNQGLQQRQNAFNEATGLFGAGINRAGQVFGQDQAIANNRNAGLGLQADIFSRLGNYGISGMGAAATSPGVSPFAGINVGNVDVTGLEGRRQSDLQNNYNQQMEQRNATIGGLAGIGGTILSAPLNGGGSIAGNVASRFGFAPRAQTQRQA